jgi:hypothetical protein
MLDFGQCYRTERTPFARFEMLQLRSGDVENVPKIQTRTSG